MKSELRKKQQEQLEADFERTWKQNGGGACGKEACKNWYCLGFHVGKSQLQRVDKQGDKSNCNECEHACLEGCNKMDCKNFKSMGKQPEDSGTDSEGGK